MPLRSVEEYQDELRHMVAQAGLTAEAHKIRLFPVSKKRRTEGLIQANNITFRDGSTLEFQELVVLDGANLLKVSYAYQFQRGSYFFRFERDPLRARGFMHAEYHLHVSGIEHANVRYLSSEIDLKQIISFIFETFYDGSGD